VPSVAVLEHDEDVMAWAEAIRGWMESRGLEEVKFLELMNRVELSVVKVWLALLLGNFEVKQSAKFYDVSGISIGLC
jgi:hypothetical protein